MADEKGWDFNAPQYVDFSGGQIFDDENVEEYFDYDHENGIAIGGSDSMDGTVANDVFSTRQSEIKRVTRSSAETQSAAPPKAGTPQRVPSMKMKSTGTPQRVPKAPSANTPQRLPDIKKEVSSTSSPHAGPEAQLPVSAEVKREPTVGAAQVKTDDVQHTPQSQGEEPKADTSSPRRTRSGKLFSPNTVEREVTEKYKNIPSNLCTNLEEWNRKGKANQNTNTLQSSATQDAATSNTKAKVETKRQNRSLERCDSLPKKQKVMSPERSNSPAKVKKSSSLQRSKSMAVRKQGSDGAPVRSLTRGLSQERQTARRSVNTSAERVKQGTPTWSQMRPNIRRSVNTSVERSGKHSRGNSHDPSVKPGTASALSETEKAKPVTLPTTPTFMRKQAQKLVKGPLKTTEELELENIAHYRKELEHKRNLSKKSLRTINRAKPMCVVQSKEPTIPEGFKFETDSRIKGHENRQDGDNKDFVSSLRSDTAPHQHPTGTKLGVTIPEPFKLSDNRKRKIPEKSNDGESCDPPLAERLAEFCKTPERFKSKPKGGPSDEKRGKIVKSPPHRVTCPKTPHFETRTRSRPVTAPTREDIEAKEIEEMQKNQFKAKPVDHRIFEDPNLRIKKVVPKPPTVPEEFHLTSNTNKLEREKPEEELYEFHAQPLNRKILEGPVGIKEPVKQPVTIPESPAFALKHRARIPIPEQPKDDKPVLRSHAPVHSGVPFLPRYEHKATMPEPFSFEERDKKRAEEKERKIEQALEEERKQREFHANPKPDYEPNLPPKKKCPLTQQQPFNLNTDIRGAQKAEEWSKKLEEELQQQKDLAKFKARKPDVLEQEPFVPIKEHKFTAGQSYGTHNHENEFSEFELSTAKRKLKREAYEMQQKQRQDELDNIRLQEERMKEEAERAEIERMRREAVHKANPVKHYKSVKIRGSDKPLTQPQSPNFQTDTRLRSRALGADSFSSL